MALTWIAYGLIAVASHDWRWIARRWGRRQWAAMVALANLMSVGVERWALAKGRWSYTAANPLVPGVGVSAIPVLQLLALFPLTFAAAAVVARGASAMSKRGLRRVLVDAGAFFGGAAFGLWAALGGGMRVRERPRPVAPVVLGGDTVPGPGASAWEQAGRGTRPSCCPEEGASGHDTYPMAAGSSPLAPEGRYGVGDSRSAPPPLRRPRSTARQAAPALVR